MSLLLNLERLKVLQLVPAKKMAARNGKAPAKEVGKPDELAAKLEEPGVLSASAIKPLRKTLTLEALLSEQNFKGFDRQAMDKLIAEINVQEPIEELLAMLRP